MEGKSSNQTGIGDASYITLYAYSISVKCFTFNTVSLVLGGEGEVVNSE